MTLDLTQTRAAKIIARLQPYLVATSYNLPFMDTAPFDLEIPISNVYDPMIVESEVFLDLLQKMDALTFGPEGMPMSRWVFYDASELPGGIYGFGLPASEVGEEVRKDFKIPDDYDGLVPFSMYIAIPTPERGTWFGHNLASLNPVFPHLGLGGLGTVTKALALRSFRTQLQVGATQWASSALFIHTRFGPLHLETAYTPAHSTLTTLTYTVVCNEESLRLALGHPDVSVDRPAPDFWIDSSDHAALEQLQRNIEAGERFCIPNAPRVKPETDDAGKSILEVPVSRVGLS